MRKTERRAVIGAAILAVTALVVGQTASAQAQTIQASNAWARRAPAMGAMDKMGKSESGGKMGAMGKMDKMGGGTGAVYVTLSNTGAQPDSLVSASSDAAQTVELHEVKNEGGVMKMRPVSTIPIPANGKTELKPGGYHIMLLGLTHDLKAGDRIPVTLKFERGGEVRVEASVK
jgi:copper(I)-binding protein